MADEQANSWEKLLKKATVGAGILAASNFPMSQRSNIEADRTGIVSLEAAEPNAFGKLLVVPNKNTRVVDQDGNVVDPSSLNGKNLMVCSGFYQCPICDKIKLTMEVAQKTLKDRDIDVELVVFNTQPKIDFASREKYLKMYTDAGFDPSHVKILFTQTKPPGAPDKEENWKGDNQVAKQLERKLMNHVGAAHSANVVIFNTKGERIKSGTMSNVEGEKAQSEKARLIVNDVETALGIKK